MASSVLARPAVVDLLWCQDNVIARRQLLELGLTPNDIRRLLRRRELTKVLDGVYVTHTGPLTPRQREWSVVLAAWPAALAEASALPELRSGVVHVAVGHDRKVRLPRGAVLHRMRDLDGRVNWTRSPPQVRPEHAILGVMSEKVAQDDIAGAFHALTQVTHRRTTIERVFTALDSRRRLPGRRLIREMLHDRREGTCSVLERGYLKRVERAHGLPRAVRQRTSTATGRRSVQDVHYAGCRLIVELDGSAFHTGAQADEDALRDLAELARSRHTTIRVTYGLVFRRPCETAHLLGEVLQQRGWAGTLRSCTTCAPAPRRRALRSSGVAQ